MSPFLTLLIGKILDYLADHADELVEAIKAKFPAAQEDQAVCNALCDLSHEPTKENLETVGQVLEAAGEDPQEVAALIVTQAKII